jgi:hypothetical protein
MSRWISGIAVVARVDTSEAPNATMLSFLCRQQ